MIFNRFSISVIIQSVLLALSGFAFIWTLYQDYLIITKFTVGLIWIFQIFILIYYVNKTNRSLSNFLQSVRYSDSVKDIKECDKSFKQLNFTYNDIIDSIKQAKIEKEAEHHYFQNTIEHVGIGLISYQPDGKVELYNKAAKELLFFSSLKDISELNKTSDELADIIINMKPNQHKLIKVEIQDELLKLSVRTTKFRIHNEMVNLVSFQNIRSELEEEEIEVWQKLIRILTHEIMNSVTPIKSLTSTIINMFEKQGKPVNTGGMNEQTINNALEGLFAIQKRSKGLLTFVQTYRSLTRIPKPRISNISVLPLFQNIKLLMDSEIKASKITLTTEIEKENIIFKADEKLITQILINLIKNSIQALDKRKDGSILLKAYMDDDDNFIIQVRDNGPGIPSDIADKIFIPFFTTKDLGSGIGLSISRQIMQMHSGSIKVNSLPGKETIVTLNF